MNSIKKIFAVVIIATISLSFCGCHKKGEIAVKVGDVEFTSAYYMCAILEADMDARQQVDNLAQTDDSIDTNKEGYYYSQKVGGKKFVTYVKDTAVEKIKELAAYKIKAKEAKLKIDSDQQKTIDAYVSYYWTSVGYSNLYEPNGVSKETFAEYFKDSYYSDLYFDYIYGKEGTKAISQDEVTTFMNENYVLAEVLTADLSSADDAEKNSKTDQFNKYYEEVKNDATVFNSIYETYNNITDDSQKQESYANVVGSDKTNYSNEDFDAIKEMKNGEVKLIKLEDGSKLTLVVKKDLAADSKQVENLDSEIRHNLKDDEFKSEIDKFKKTLKYNEIKSATKQFNIKKIEYPQTQSTNQ